MNHFHPKVILQRAGDASPLAINHDKCLIRTVHNEQHIDCCAIFNGPHGTALRSYTAKVLVNGEPTSVKWLSVGDQIQLPCSTQIEVKAVTTQPIGFDRNPNFVAPKMLHSKNSSVDSSVVPQQDPMQVEPKEEVFFSPLSPNPEAVETSDSQDAKPNLDSELEELESIFARLGVTSVGSIATPSSATPSSPVEKPAVAAELTADASEAPPMPAEEVGFAVNIRREIESAIANTTDSSSIAQPTVTNDVESFVHETQPKTGKENSMSENLVATNPEPVASIPAAVPAAVEVPVTSAAPVVPQPVVPQAVVPQPPQAVAPQAVAPQAVVPPTSVPQPVAPNTVVEESTSPANDDALSELPSDLRNQLNDLVSSLELESAKAPAEISTPIVSATESPVAPPEAVEVPVVEPAAVVEEPVAVVEEPIGVVEPPAMKPTSVADVLGNMGIEVPGADEMAAEPEAASTAVSQSVDSMPSEMGVPTSPVFANMDATVEQAAEAPETPTSTQQPAPGAGAEDDIQAYMDRLLNRTTAPAAPSPISAPSGDAAPAATTPEQDPADTVLSAEEFVPTHRASRPENYDKLREIANSSSRNAVRNSSIKAKKQSFLLKVVVCLLALVGSLVALWFGMTFPSFVLGIVGVVFALLSVMGRG